MSDHARTEQLQSEYQDHIKMIGRRLRQLAGEIEGRTITTNLDTLLPDYAMHCSNTQHTVLWGLANLNLERLTTKAGAVERSQFLDLERKLDEEQVDRLLPGEGP